MRYEIYKELKSRIVELKYMPNECLTEKKLADEFKVSRTPIREAIILLSAENLVTITPNNSIRVSEINLKDLQDLISYRVVLEKGAARLLIASATEDDLNSLVLLRDEINKFKDKCTNNELINFDSKFHFILAKAIHNKLLEKSLSNVHCQFIRIQKLINHRPKKLSLHIDTIINALKIKDGERIENCLVEHVYNFGNIINESLNNVK